MGESYQAARLEGGNELIVLDLFAPSWHRPRDARERACLAPSGRPPPIRDRAFRRARHHAAAAPIRVLGGERIATAVGTARRPRSAQHRGRDLDRRDQVLDRGFPRRPKMDGLSRALRPAVLRHHARRAVRDFPERYRADRRRRVRRADQMRGAGAPPACLDAQEHDAQLSRAARHCACRRSPIRPGRSRRNSKVP